MPARPDEADIDRQRLGVEALLLEGRNARHVLAIGHDAEHAHLAGLGLRHITSPMELNATSMWPPSRAVSICAPPVKFTVASLMPTARWKPTLARWLVERRPAVPPLTLTDWPSPHRRNPSASCRGCSAAPRWPARLRRPSRSAAGWRACRSIADPGRGKPRAVGSTIHSSV